MRRSEVGSKRQDPRAKPSVPELRIPHDPVNEIVLIAAALVDRSARTRLVNAVSPDALHGKNHAEIWEVVRELERRNLDYDPATVRQLSGGGVDERYVQAIVEQRPNVPAGPSLAHHLGCLAWDQVRIECAKGPLSLLLEALREVQSEPELVRSLARNVAAAFQGQGLLKYLRDGDHVLDGMRKAIRKRRSGIACYPFGIEGFDKYVDGELDKDGNDLGGQWRIMPGFAPKQVTVITGVPGGGKSTITCRIVNELALRQNRRVLFGAWEMEGEYSLELCGIIELGLSRTAFQSGTISDEEDELHYAKCEEIGKNVRFMELPFGRVRGEKQLNDRNLDTIHSYIAETGAEVAVFDLFRRALRQRDPDEEEQALERIQSIMKETNCHGVLLQQQRAKDLEARPDRRPTREAIKGSGAWFEVPDQIVGVHMPGLWKTVAKETLELIILKQRRGKWPLAVEFDWDADSGGLSIGRGIDYARPGEATGMDAFLEGERASERRKGGSRERRRRA